MARILREAGSARLRECMGSKFFFNNPVTLWALYVSAKNNIQLDAYLQISVKEVSTHEPGIAALMEDNRLFRIKAGAVLDVRRVAQ
jgi:hypothetical protein